MSWVKRLGGRLPDFEEVVRRFPLAVFTMAAFTIWIIVKNHTRFSSYRHEEYIFGGFILAGYLAVIATLISESRDWPKGRGVILGIALALPAFLICYFGQQLDFNVPMAVAAAILFLGNAAAWRASRDDRKLWNFTQKFWTGAIFAVVGSVIFTLGMFAISEAVKALFGVNLEDLTIDTILPIGLAFLSPVYWLGTIPRYGEAEDVAELSFEARALSFLGTWMLAPLVSIYALIILAYGAKTLIQWELPKGEIAMLVTPFLGIGMLVWLILEPKVLKAGGFVRFYRRIWHWIMLAATVLLAIAVFVRIREYGLTVERFFLALIALWAFAQSIWFTLLPAAKRDIRIPTGIAAGLLAFGAFAAGPMSLYSQFSRAKAAVAEMPSLEPEVVRNNPEQARKLLAGLEYVIKKQDEKRFKQILPDEDMPSAPYAKEWKILQKKIGLDKVANKSRSYYMTYSVTSEKPITVEADSQFFGSYPIQIYLDRKYESSSDIIEAQNGLKLTLSVEGKNYAADLTDVIKSLDLKYANDRGKDIVVAPLSVISADGKVATLLILDGDLSYRDDELKNMKFDVALIVPN